MVEPAFRPAPSLRLPWFLSRLQPALPGSGAKRTWSNLAMRIGAG